MGRRDRAEGTLVWHANLALEADADAARVVGCCVAVGLDGTEWRTGARLQDWCHVVFV